MQSVAGSAKPRTVACPACGKKSEWTPQNAFRPFCSARCKGIDLGAWASESYRIAGGADELRSDSADDN